MSLIPVAASSLPFLKLSHTVHGHILSFLDVKSLVSCKGTSKQLSAVTVMSTNNDMNSFIDEICSKLNDDTQLNRKEELLSIKSSISEGFSDLLSIKNQIIGVLMCLSEDTLIALQAIPAPNVFGNIWHIAQICRCFPTANSIEDVSDRGRALQDICKELALAGDMARVNALDPGAFSNALKAGRAFEKAIAVAKSIPDETTRQHALLGAEMEDTGGGIPTSFLEEGYFILGSGHLRFLSKTLFSKGKVDEAIEVATSNTPDINNNLLLALVNDLIQANNPEKAASVAQSISDASLCGCALSIIAMATGQEDRAIALAKSILDESIQSMTLLSIFRDLMHLGSETMKTAQRIDSELRLGLQSTLEKMATALVAAGRLDEAITVTYSMSVPSSARDSILLDISERLRLRGDFVRADEIADRISPDGRGPRPLIDDDAFEFDDDAFFLPF